jgi:ElaB/YqjD/DUF883 family membrane-anchored ribosome-binding protein
MQTQSQNFANDTSVSDAAGADPRMKLDQAANRAHETVDRVHRKASEISERFTSDGEHYYRQACGWISAHPVQAVGAALLAGYLFGRIRS